MNAFETMTNPHKFTGILFSDAIPTNQDDTTSQFPNQDEIRADANHIYQAKIVDPVAGTVLWMRTPIGNLPVPLTADDLTTVPPWPMEMRNDELFIYVATAVDIGNSVIWAKCTLGAF